MKRVCMNIAVNKIPIYRGWSVLGLTDLSKLVLLKDVFVELRCRALTGLFKISLPVID